MKSSAPHMTPPERPTICSPWSATGPLQTKCSQPSPCCIPPHSEARPAGLSIARRRIENATGETGKRGLHHLRIPPEGHLTERHRDAHEPRSWAASVMQPDAHVKSPPSPIEFEMAYQVRVAIDRIRFAIKAT